MSPVIRLVNSRKDWCITLGKNLSLLNVVVSLTLCVAEKITVGDALAKASLLNENIEVEYEDLTLKNTCKFYTWLLIFCDKKCPTYMTLIPTYQHLILISGTVETLFQIFYTTYQLPWSGCSYSS